MELLDGLLGERERYRRYVALSIAVFALTFSGYAVGVFQLSGGVVFLPFYAAVVGVVAASLVGNLRGGLVFGWLAVYASLLGSHADHVLFGISERPATERLVAFFSPDGLAFFAVEAVVIGSVGFVLGHLLRVMAGFVRDRFEPFAA